MHDTLFCHVEEDPEGFHSAEVRGFSVRLALAPGGPTKGAAAQAIDEFLRALPSTTFAAYRIAGTTATKIEVQIEVSRDPVNESQAEALLAEFKAWLLGSYSARTLSPGYLCPDLPGEGTPTTVNADTLAVHDVMLATASRPAPFPQRLGLAATLRISRQALQELVTGTDELLIASLAAPGYTAPHTADLEKAPVPGDEVELISADSPTRCRAVVVKPLVTDPTSLIDPKTGFFKPSDNSPDAHRFLKRLEQRGGSLFTGFFLATTTRWNDPPNPPAEPGALHACRLSWQAITGLAGALDPILLALCMPGRETRDGAWLGAILDTLGRHLADSDFVRSGAARVSGRQKLRELLRGAIRQHPALAGTDVSDVSDSIADRFAYANAVRDACGLAPMPATFIASTPDGVVDAAPLAQQDWLTCLLSGHVRRSAAHWQQIDAIGKKRFHDATGESRELDRLLAALQDSATSEAGIEAATLRWLRRPEVAESFVTGLAQSWPITGPQDLENLRKDYDRAIDAFGQRLDKGLNGALLTREAVGSLLADVLTHDLLPDPGAPSKPLTLDALKSRFEAWDFWACRVDAVAPKDHPEPIGRMLEVLVCPQTDPSKYFKPFGEQADTSVLAAARALRDDMIATLCPPDSARFMPDAAPAPLAIQVLVDAAADDAGTSGDDFSAVFSGVAVLLRARRPDQHGKWAHANLAEASYAPAAGNVTAMTVSPIPTTVMDGRRQLFVEYHGVPFASRAFEQALPTTVGDAKEQVVLIGLDYRNIGAYEPVPALAFGTRYEVAVHAVGRSGVLPLALQHGTDEPWLPVPEVPTTGSMALPLEACSFLPYSRTTAIGRAAILDADSERRIGVATEGVRPLAADYPRLSLAASHGGNEVFLDVLRNADGTGAISLQGNCGALQQVTLRDIRLWGDAVGAILTIEVHTVANAAAIPLVSGGPILSRTFSGSGADCVLTFTRDGAGQVFVRDAAKPTSGAQVPAGGAAWLRLRLIAPNGCSVSLADPVGDQEGEAAASRPMPSRLLLCGEASGPWLQPLKAAAHLRIDFPRATWANVQRWLANPALRDEWLQGLSSSARNALRVQLLAADVLRPQVPALARLLDLLPDPAVRYLELDVQPLDGLRGKSEDLQAVAEFRLDRRWIDVLPLGKVVKSIYGDDAGTIAKANVVELLSKLTNAYGTALKVLACARADARWLGHPSGDPDAPGNGPFTLCVPEGMTVQVRARPLVLRAHFDASDAADGTGPLAPVMDPRILQWSIGTVQVGAHAYVRFEGADLQVEAMLGPLTAEGAASSTSPWRKTRAEWADLALRSIRHEALGVSRNYRLQAQAHGPDDEWPWRQLGWVDLDTQRWRFTGRPLQHWFAPPALAVSPVKDGQASFEIGVDAGVSSFMEEAFENRMDADAQERRTALLPLPGATALPTMAWDKPSATVFRHRITVRSRYEGAMARAEDGRCEAWLLPNEEGGLAATWRSIVMLADRKLIELGRPQLRALLALTSTSLDPAAGPATPPILVILQDPPFDQGGLAERITSEMRPGIGYVMSGGPSGVQARPGDLRKEVGPDPRLSYRALDAATAQALLLSPQGPIGLTFDTPQGMGQAFANSAVLLHPRQLVHARAGAPGVLVARLEESFINVALRRYLDPDWLVAEEPPGQGDPLAAFDGAWWFENCSFDDAVPVCLDAAGISLALIAGQRVSPNGRELLEMYMPAHLVDSSVALPDSDTGGPDGAWLKVATLPLGQGALECALLHVPGSGGAATLGVFVKPPSAAEAPDELGNGWELVSSVDWSAPAEWGAVQLRALQNVKARRTGASAATGMRWARTGRDFDTVFIGGAEDADALPVERLSGRLDGSRRALTLHDKGGQALWVRSRQSAQRFPTSTQRHMAGLLSAQIHGLGQPTEQLLTACMMKGAGLQVPTLAAGAEQVRLLELEVPSRPCVFMPGDAPWVPAEYRAAYHDLLAVGMGASKLPLRLSFHLRLIGAGDTLAQVEALSLGLRADSDTTAWPINLARPAAASPAALHAVELDIDIGDPLKPQAAMQAMRWITDDGRTLDAKAEDLPLPFTFKAANAFASGLYLALLGMKRADGKEDELWAESSMLVSRGGSSAGFGGAVDFDWFFGTSADDPAQAVSEAGLREMPEAQARLIAVSPPVAVKRAPA